MTNLIIRPLFTSPQSGLNRGTLLYLQNLHGFFPLFSIQVTQCISIVIQISEVSFSMCDQNLLTQFTLEYAIYKIICQIYVKYMCICMKEQ